MYVVKSDTATWVAHRAAQVHNRSMADTFGLNTQLIVNNQVQTVDELLNMAMFLEQQGKTRESEVYLNKALNVEHVSNFNFMFKGR